MNNRNPGTGLRFISQLLELDKSQTLPRQLQLDVANQLMSEGKWQESADAYEKFLSLYSGYEYAEQVHLMLGLLYSRYLIKTEGSCRAPRTGARPIKRSRPKRHVQTGNRTA